MGLINIKLGLFNAFVFMLVSSSYLAEKTMKKGDQ